MDAVFIDKLQMVIWQWWW